jgi:hypothetical protein
MDCHYVAWVGVLCIYQRHWCGTLCTTVRAANTPAAAAAAAAAAAGRWW